MAKILRKSISFFALFSLAGGWAWPKWDFLKKLECGILAGLTFTRMDAVSVYQDTWNQELLKNVVEETVIAPNKRAAPAIRLLATYYFRPKLGLQAGLGFSSGSVPNTATFNLEYAWKSGLRGNLAGEWKGTGRLRSMPFFINAVWRTRGNRFGVNASAGPAVFLNSARASATAGFGVSEVTTILTYTPPDWTQTIVQNLDAVPAALEIAKTRWTSVGFNAGLAGECTFGGGLAAILDIRFFYSPPKDIGWTWTPGTFPGMIDPASSWTVSADLARYAETRTTAFHVDPSYFQIAAGVKLDLR
jgi:hypothetical protein